jgi:hypothetical protein
MGLGLIRRLPVSPSLGRPASPEPPDFNHMAPIAAHLLASLTPCIAGFLGREFMGRTLLMSGHAPFASDFALFMTIH